MEAIVSLIALVGMGVAAFAGIKWMLKNGHMNPHKEQPLTPNDLKVLEESAARLMVDLRAVTDECVARIESACAQAESCVKSKDDSTSLLSLRVNACQDVTAAPVAALAGTIQSPESAAQVARQSGFTTGEVELLRGLESISTR